jgi:hypothetical protein
MLWLVVDESVRDCLYTVLGGHFSRENTVLPTTVDLQPTGLHSGSIYIAYACYHMLSLEAKHYELCCLVHSDPRQTLRGSQRDQLRGNGLISKPARAEASSTECVSGDSFRDIRISGDDLSYGGTMASNLCNLLI